MTGRVERLALLWCLFHWVDCGIILGTGETIMFLAEAVGPFQEFGMLEKRKFEQSMVSVHKVAVVVFNGVETCRVLQENNCKAIHDTDEAMCSGELSLQISR